MAWIGSIVNGVMAIGSAAQQKHAAEYNMAVDANNQIIAEERSKLNVMEVEHQNRTEEGAQRAAYGGSGVTMSGSPMDEFASKAISDSFKVQVAKFNGLVDAGHDMAQGAIDQMAGNQAVLTGAANVSGLAAQYLTNKYGGHT
jgi:hypothetical protein